MNLCELLKAEKFWLARLLPASQRLYTRSCYYQYYQELNRVAAWRFVLPTATYLAQLTEPRDSPAGDCFGTARWHLNWAWPFEGWAPLIATIRRRNSQHRVLYQAGDAAGIRPTLSIQRRKHVGVQWTDDSKFSLWQDCVITMFYTVRQLWCLLKIQKTVEQDKDKGGETDRERISERKQDKSRKNDKQTKSNNWPNIMSTKWDKKLTN